MSARSRPAASPQVPAVGLVCLAFLWALAGAGLTWSAHLPTLPGYTSNPNPPAQTVKLVFIHHSTGGAWLADPNSDQPYGGLGRALMNDNYYVSATNYGWGPENIGDRTDIPNWPEWFTGPNSAAILSALYSEGGQNFGDFGAWPRPASAPAGENQIVMFKSCFPNSDLYGQPDDPPLPEPNDEFTVANAKAVYNKLLTYFAIRQDKLFIVIAAPPLMQSDTAPERAANARAFDNWLVNEWLSGYPYVNVAVFDYYNVLTSNGSPGRVDDPETTEESNDAGWADGNHHRWQGAAIQHTQTISNNFSAYPSGDSHPTSAGHQKATAEFVQLLNVFYHRWQAGQGTPTLTPPTVAPTRTPTATRSPTLTSALTSTPTATALRFLYLPLILRQWPSTVPLTPTPTASATASPTGTTTHTPIPNTPIPNTPTSTPTASTTPAAGLCSGPEPPLLADLQVRQPPALAEPAPRAPFRDPVFGRCVVRVTDRTNDKSEPGGLKNEYSRVQSFDASETRLLAMSTQGGWYLYDAQTLQPLGPLPLGADPRWSAADPDLIYFSEETRLMSYNIATQQTAVVHEFAGDFPGQNLAVVWTRYEGSPSRDGRWWGLMAEDQDWLTAALLVYDLTANRVTATLDTRGWPADAREMDSVTISPLGNYFLVYMDLYCEPGQLGTPANPCGLMVYDRNLQNGRGLLRIVGHSDAALDVQGREVLVYQDIDTDHIAMLDLASGAVTALWPIDFTYTAIGLHISGRALDRPGWAVISTHDGDAASHTWMDDQVFLIELKANGRVVRLAHTHSVVDENQEHDYWAEPQASANRDLSRVLFTTNWGRSGTEGVEMYLIALPAGWAADLP